MVGPNYPLACKLCMFYSNRLNYRIYLHLMINNDSYFSVRLWLLCFVYLTLKKKSKPVKVNVLLLFSHSVMSNSLWPHGLQHARLPSPSLSSGVCSNSCPLNQWCHPTISSSASCPPTICLLPIQPSPPALSLSQHQGLFKWIRSSHQVAKVLEFQLQHQSFQWIIRIDFL